MKQILHIVLLGASFALMQSCSHKITGSLTQSHERTDSVHVAERIRTVDVVIPGDSLNFEVPFVLPDLMDCGILDSCRLYPAVNYDTVVYSSKGKRSSAKITISRQGRVNRILAQFNCDQYVTQIQAKDSLIEHLQHERDSSTEVRVVRERYVPAIYKWCLGFTITALCILIFFIATKILKKTTIWGRILSLIRL